MKKNIKKLVLMRLKTFSDEIGISIGNKELKKEELIDNVEKETKIGEIIAQSQIEFLRDLAKGKIYEVK